MSLSKIKKEHAEKVVFFGGLGKTPLGKRDDIDKLAIMAHKSGQKSLIALFDVLPPLDDLLKADTDKQLAKGPKKAADTSATKTNE